MMFFGRLSEFLKNLNRMYLQGPLQRQLQQGFDLVFSIGTTSVFPYIAQPVFDAKMWGAKSIEINPGETEVSEYVDSKLAMGAVAALNAIWGDTGTAD